MKYIKVVLLWLFIFVLFLLCPWILEKIIDFLMCVGIINYCSKNLYLSFYSSIIGGSIALIGVWITLLNDRKEKKEEDSIKYKPILRVFGINEHDNCLLREVHFNLPFSSNNDDPKKEKKYDLFSKQTRSEVPLFRLVFKNVGRGETFNAILEKAEVKEVSWDTDSNLSFAGGWNQYVGEICKDELFGVDFYLPEYLFITEDLNGRYYHEISFNLYINYSDMFNRVKYQDIVHIKLKVTIEKIESEEPYYYKNNFKWAKVNYELHEILPQKNIYSEKQKKYVHEIYSKLNIKKRKNKLKMQ